MVCFIILKRDFFYHDRLECERMALLDHKYHFVLTEFENLVSSFARIHLSPLEFSAAATPFAGLPFSLPLAPDFRRALSYLYFHLLSAFLGVLHAPACTTYLPSRLREASTRCCFLGSPSTAFHVARMGERTRSNPDAAPGTAQTHYGFIVRH